MRKQTKTSLTRKLDRECSRIIRSQGQCAYCKMVDYEKLQCAHIFSRSYRNTRWSLNNLLPLCQACHFRAHKQPTEFTEFVKIHLGEYNYVRLRSQHYAIKRWTIPEMEELLNTLRSL